jgi:hypothetical protein
MTTRLVARWVCWALLLGASLAFGQEAGYRELQLPQAHDKQTANREGTKQTTAATQSECPDGDSVTITDGEAVDREAKADKIEITILDVTPSVVQEGSEFLVTMRIKNLGKRALRVPWLDTYPEPQNPDDYEYDLAYINVNLKTGTKDSWLESAIELIGVPGDARTYLLLDPGHWITLKAHVLATCHLPKESWACSPVVSDDRASLTGRWVERHSTHKHVNCSYVNGSYYYRSRESRSAPFTLAVRAPQTAQAVRK